MKTFKLQITEDELVALIEYHTGRLSQEAMAGRPTNDTAQRLVDLTRRLNKDMPEIEGDPRPNNGGQLNPATNALPEGW